jgi:magnesium-transporting ATPase (P-type)
VIAFAAFWWLGATGNELYRAATLLVAASPCAIVISVPAAILSALSAAARGGVLFKGGAALETLARSTFAFDKTGTLTTGKAVVTAWWRSTATKRCSFPPGRNRGAIRTSQRGRHQAGGGAPIRRRGGRVEREHQAERRHRW